jgi:hypothetical protein
MLYPETQLNFLTLRNNMNTNINWWHNLRLNHYMPWVIQACQSSMRCPHQNLSFSWRFQRNTSRLPCRWMFAKFWSKAFQDTSRCPDKSLLNVIFGGEHSITFGNSITLWRTILYNVGYCSRRVAVPSHLSSQDRIDKPSLMENLPRQKKCFFVP